MVQRLTYRRRHSYNTKSNHIRRVKCPGGQLNVQYVKKKTKGPQTPAGDTGRLHGVPAKRPAEFKRLRRSRRRVTRPYGGVLSHQAVRDRIVRAFLVEEQKIVKKVLKMQQQGKK